MEQSNPRTVRPALKGSVPGDWHPLTADRTGPASHMAERISRLLSQRLRHSRLPSNTVDVRVAHNFLMSLIISVIAPEGQYKEVVRARIADLQNFILDFSPRSAVRQASVRDLS